MSHSSVLQPAVPTTAQYQNTHLRACRKYSLRWRALHSTTMSSPLARSLPCSMPTTTVLVSCLPLTDLTRVVTNQSSRRCCQRLGYLGLFPLRHLPPGHDLGYHLRDGRCHHCRCPYRRHHQERYHSQQRFPWRCWCSDACLHLRSGWCLHLGHVVHKTFCSRLFLVLAHLFRCWCRCRCRWC